MCSVLPYSAGKWLRTFVLIPIERQDWKQNFLPGPCYNKIEVESKYKRVIQKLPRKKKSTTNHNKLMVIVT